MTESELTGILRDAMAAERDGFTFYSVAAERAEDPGAREAFAKLAADERAHFDALQTGYKALLAGEPWAPRRWGSEPEASGIFSDDFVRRIAGKHFEMSALSIGILLEKNAYAFYSSRAAEARDEEVARFFRELAEWENGHYQLLLRQDEAVKEAYWSENRFAPLL